MQEQECNASQDTLPLSSSAMSSVSSPSLNSSPSTRPASTRPASDEDDDEHDHLDGHDDDEGRGHHRGDGRRRGRGDEEDHTPVLAPSSAAPTTPVMQRASGNNGRRVEGEPSASIPGVEELALEIGNHNGTRTRFDPLKLNEDANTNGAKDSAKSSSSDE